MLYKSKEDLVIIGTLPPPVGGVTIHTKRLLDGLAQKKISCGFVLTKNIISLKSIQLIAKSKIVHLQLSNIYVSFLLVIGLRLLRKKVVLTRHGDINRNHGTKRAFDLLTIKYSNIPIILNKNSYDIATKYNKSAQLLSAFIPPRSEEDLPQELNNRINRIKKEFKYIFCTNAYDLSFDTNGKETYGILELINLFKNFPDYFLIAATCNPNYKSYLSHLGLTLPLIILIVDYPINFLELLRKTDASIRNTTTDGDALSIREALYVHRIVFATDCVPRPDGVIIYHSINDLKHILETFSPYYVNTKTDSTLDRIINIYTTLSL